MLQKLLQLFGWGGKDKTDATMMMNDPAVNSSVNPTEPQAPAEETKVDPEPVESTPEVNDSNVDAGDDSSVDFD